MVRKLTKGLRTERETGIEKSQTSQDRSAQRLTLDKHTTEYLSAHDRISHSAKAKIQPRLHRAVFRRIIALKVTKR